jgi:GTP cyclohydrolase I
VSDDHRDDPIAAATERTIQALGYEPDAHLTGTPGRVARFMRQWHTVGHEPPKLTTFPNEPRVDQLVLVKGIRFYSLCAHHGLPFVGEAAVGYIPRDSVLGLSKFARVVDHFARRFQVQERLTEQVASYLIEGLDPAGLGVVLSAEHFCMSMRGIQRPGHRTTTSALYGALKDQGPARAELMALYREA